MNRNQLFEEKVRIMATGARSWPGLNYIVRDSVPPGTTGPVQISIDVPDTAAVGVYPLTLTVTRQGLTVLGQCQTALVIGPPVAVEPGAKPAVNVAAIRPNPTAGATEISFVLAADARTRVVIYGVRGERVRTLLDGEHPAGAHSLRWDGRDASGRFVAPGIYVVRFEAPGWSATRRIAVVR
jgi:hypothetical protein